MLPGKKSPGMLQQPLRISVRLTGYVRACCWFLLDRIFALRLTVGLTITQVNMKFHGLNYAMNVANTLANRELREKVAAEERRTSILESSLAECTVTIESLNNSVAHLEDESG